MSDNSISIVPKLSTYPGKEIKAKEIVTWLVSLDIVNPELSDCTLGPDKGYSISNGAKFITTDPAYLPYDLLTNGLAVFTERMIYLTGQSGLEELICPDCKQNIAYEDLDFLSEWIDNISNNLTCPVCSVSTDIHQFRFIPEWGFSDLGFTFWNWPSFSEEFINQFQQRLGCEISVVYCHV